ncbi:DNA polymerase III subunit gamma/tau [Rhodopirellula sp. P2]|uniref:DNA polymerase III subunit gamma/tau n=1 Tax=Rhodopirellula sp. P2 TaxID=2127060 RepID=UPI002367AC8D|nr:DNA polymerase III subunit gamma/tau [Rhodopirellula sp. P2]WDQ18965.1 DNA polymerase III subunit gamma/tau [Rhodopirellula sp. P2]
MSDDHSADDGSYVVVARRYRPRDFTQLVGQDHVARALQGAIETSRVGHAYLFTGARGVGKTSTARIFAKALNHPDGPTANPDNESDVAQAIDSGEDVDVIEIDGASNRGIDEIRSLRANVGVRPSRSRYKIYIIDEVHMLTGAAFNALLKTLEEPPEHVKFIFCTTDPEKIPITVLSRCQRFDFAPVESDKIVQRLREIVEAENNTVEEEALELLARRAAGSMRDSQSLLEQVLSFSDGHLTADHVHTMLGTADDQRLHRLAEAMAARDAAAALSQIDEAIAEGVDAGRLAEQMLGYFRDLMAVAVGCEASLMRYAAASMHGALGELAGRWGLQTVLAIVGLVDETLVRIRHSVHARVLLEATVIQVCHLPDLQAISDLAAAASGASGGKGGSEKKKRPPVASSAPAAAPAAPHSGSASDREAANVRVDSASEPAAAHQATASSAQSVAPATATSSSSPPASPSSAPVAQASSPTGSSQSPAVPPATAGAESSGERAASTTSTDDYPLISSEEAKSGWSQVLQEMDPMTATLAKAAERVDSPEPGVLRLVFPGSSGLALSRCQMPEHKEEILRTVARVTGRRATLQFEATAVKKAEPVAAAKPKNRNRMQRMREIQANPLVQSCVELLGAEIVRVDTPRG